MRSPRDASVLPPVEIVDELPEESLPAFIAELAGLTTRAAARWRASQRASPRSEKPGSELLRAKEAARVLQMSEDWVRRNGRREGLVVQVGRRTLRYSRRAIESYINRQSRSPLAR